MLAKGLTPILNVSSMQESFAWFAKLGWQEGWEWGIRRIQATTPGVMHVRHPDGHVFRVSKGEGH